MPGIDLEKQPFLTAEQEDLLASDLLEEVNPLTAPEQALAPGAWQNMVNQNIYVHSAVHSALPPTEWLMARTTAELTVALQNVALSQLDALRRLKAAEQLFASKTGKVFARGNDKETAEGLEFGHILVYTRAMRQTTALLMGTLTLTNTLQLSDGPEVLLSAVSDTYGALPLVKPPRIDEAEIKQLSDLQQKVIDHARETTISTPLKPSPHRITSHVRLGVFALRNRLIMGIHASDIGPHRRLFESTALLQAPDFTEAERRATLAIVRKLKRYIEDAAIFDPEIAADPRARLMSFLDSRVRGINLPKEQAAYDAEVQRVADIYLGSAQAPKKPVFDSYAPPEPFEA